MNMTRRLVAFLLFIFSWLTLSEAAFAVEFSRPRSLLGDDICRMAVAPQGDIYTFSPLINGALGYRILSADLTREIRGEIFAVDTLLDCPQAVIFGANGLLWLPLSSQNHSLIYELKTAEQPVTASLIYQSATGRIPLSSWLDDDGTTLSIVTARSMESEHHGTLEAIDIATRQKQTLTVAQHGNIGSPESRDSEAVAEFPLTRLTHNSVNVVVSPPVYDPVTGEGYSYYRSTAAINAADSGREWGIWRFDPQTQKRDIIFRKAGVGKLQSLVMHQRRLYALVSGELNLFHLAEADMALDKRWTQLEEIIEGEPLAASADLYQVRWEVRDQLHRIRQQGDILLDSADKSAGYPGFWPLRVAEKINAQQAFLQAGEREKNRHILPLASSYRNHLWLPTELQARGWTASLSAPLADRSAPIQTLAWFSNPVADFTAITLAEGEALSDRVCLKLEKRLGGNEYFPLTALHTHNHSRWSYDLARAINRSPVRNYIGAGAFINNELVPLFSKFRNRLWLKNLNDDHQGLNYNKYSGFSYQQGSCPGL